MFKLKSLAAASAAVLALSPGLVHATTTFGSLSNFDTVNDTGHEAHGFEIDLEDVSSSDVLNTFGGIGRGFPPTVERYGAPVIQDYTSGGHNWTRVVYQSSYANNAWAASTPTGPYSTPGDSCWTGGGIGYGPSTPCDHFGVELSKGATQTNYNWLVEGATPGSLVLGGSSVPAPTWTVTPAPPPAPGQPPAPPVVMAQIAAADPQGGLQFGKAMWVKVATTEYDHPVGLYDLVDNNPIVQGVQTEIEWQLIQKEAGVPGSGLIENGGAVQQGAESVVRQYFFYNYAGAIDPQTGEALPISDATPSGGDLGAFIGGQDAAVNFGQGAPGAVPEPAAWAMMLAGFGVIGAALRGRKSPRRDDKPVSTGRPLALL